MSPFRGGPKPEAARLREFPTFGKLSDQDLQRIAKVARHTSLPEGWVMIHEQTPADGCYILLAGKVAISHGDQRIAEVGPGELIGEIAVRQNRLRSASVTTTERVDLLWIDSKDLDRLMGETPALRTAIDDSMARHDL